MGVWPNFAEGEHNRERLSFERYVEQFGAFGHAPSDEANPDPRFAGGIHFAREPSFVTIAPADNTKPPGCTYGSSKPPVSDDVHWGKQNGVLDAKKLS